jgi:hypothetical protein
VIQSVITKMAMYTLSTNVLMENLLRLKNFNAPF